MMYFEVMKRLDNGKKVPILDPITDMDIESKSLSKLLESKKVLTDELDKIQESNSLTLAQEKMYAKKSDMKSMIKDLS